jgi:hypothetical protein
LDSGYAVSLPVPSLRTTWVMDRARYTASHAAFDVLAGTVPLPSTNHPPPRFNDRCPSPTTPA